MENMMQTIQTSLILAFVVLPACGLDLPSEPLTAAPAPAPLVEPEASDPGSRDEGAETDLAGLEEVVDAAEVEDEPMLAELAHAPELHATYTVRRGESLAHFARWSGLTVEEIAAWSELDLGGSLSVGTEIVVPLVGEERARLDARRRAHHERRAEGYLATRGGSLGTEFVTVRTGDTAWRLANDQLGIPVWLLETYNPSVDLEQLRPGQELMVPVLGDRVAVLDGP